MEPWTFYVAVLVAAVLGGAISAGRPGASGSYPNYSYRLFASTVAGLFAALGVKAYVWPAATIEAYCVIAGVAAAVGLHIVSGLDALAAKVERDPGAWFFWRGKNPPTNSNEGK